MEIIIALILVGIAAYIVGHIYLIRAKKRLATKALSHATSFVSDTLKKHR